MAAKKGRPVSKTGPAAAKARAAAKKSWDKKSPTAKRAVVQNRDKAAQTRADNKRAKNPSPARKAYRAKEAASMQAAAKTKPPKPKNCQWPGCNRTDIQWHHQGIDKWLCPVHHAQARLKAGGK